MRLLVRRPSTSWRQALDRTQLLGLPTNRRFLAGCLRHPGFRAGAALIPFLDHNAGELREALIKEEELALVPSALAAFYAGPDERGTELPCPFPRLCACCTAGACWCCKVRERADGALEVDQEGQAQSIEPPTGAWVRTNSGAWHVQSGALDLVVEDVSFQPAANPGGAAGANELRAPFNGKVISVKAAARQHCRARRHAAGPRVDEAGACAGRLARRRGEGGACRAGPAGRYCPGAGDVRGGGMNVGLQQDIDAMSDTVKRFTLERIAPHVAAWDEAGEFPRELYREAASLGLLGLGYPEALGGTPAPSALRNAVYTTMAHHSGSGGLMARPVLAEHRPAAGAAAWHA
jgi:hypothetical protein